MTPINEHKNEHKNEHINKRIRVLVVEDSLTVRKRLCEILEADSNFEVVGEAEDGKQAIELCLALRPDIITLDMMMPVMSGLAATEYIMAYCATPILVVSSSINRGELFKTYEALAAGAVEVMEKPKADEADDEWEQRFIAMLKLVVKVKVITHMRGRLNSTYRTLPPAQMPRPQHLQRAKGAEGKCSVIALGASTGGPGAIIQVLQDLPADFPLPILIVIHIGEPFSTAFADWLDDQTEHAVSIAQNGQRLIGVRGVFIAPSNRHLVVRKGCMYLDDGPERHSCRPSVDVLFESLALDYGAAVTACLLTGMGADGARGLLAIRQAGGLTIAQDESSSIVYGMPREAALLNAAQRILPLDDIGSALAAQVLK